MCNAKPGTRCDSDTYQSMSIAVRNIKKRVEKNPNIVDTPRFTSTLAELDDKIVQYLATNKSIESPNKAFTESRALAASLPDDIQARLTPIGDLQITAKYLNVFQNRTDLARKTAKQEGKEYSQRDSAYDMATTDFPEIENSIMANIYAKHAVGELSDEELQYHQSSLTTAAGVMKKEAEEILAKDIKENSKIWRNNIRTNEVTRMTRNRDGSFTIANTFEIETNSKDNALTAAEESFELENVGISLAPNKSGSGYTVNTSYILKAVDIENAKKIHQKIFKGTPRLRASLANIEAVAKQTQS